jgi:hypothetical protein
LLRTLPVAGNRMVAAQLGASTVAMTAAQIALILPGGLLLMLSGLVPRSSLIPLAIIAAVIALPALNAIALGIQNGMALWIPAWTRIGHEQPGGVEFMGAQMMTLFAALIAFLLAMIPPLIVASIGVGATAFKWGNYAAIPGALMFIAALYGEVVLMVNLLGRVYERIDPVESGLLQ